MMPQHQTSRSRKQDRWTSAQTLFRSAIHELRHRLSRALVAGSVEAHGLQARGRSATPALLWITDRRIVR
jgi:hypothetical protein